MIRESKEQGLFTIEQILRGKGIQTPFINKEKKLVIKKVETFKSTTINTNGNFVKK